MSGGGPQTLIANFGAEEGAGWVEAQTTPAVATTARLWRMLFARDAALTWPTAAAPVTEVWPPALSDAPSEPVFGWLARCGDRVPWLVTADESAEPTTAAPPAEIVARVHDKAFAHAQARRERLLPPSLRDCIAVLDPEELRDADSALAHLHEHLSHWPARARAHFTLKPRLGSSGRGRVAGRAGRVDTPEIRGALPRLAARGGALLEPWLERTADFSAQLFVPREPDEPVIVLGTLEQLVTASGMIRGHRGQIDSRGRVFCGHPREEAVREAGALLAIAARQEGFFGPCGSDAFEFLAFEGDEGEEATTTTELRAASEYNARFTLGHVCLGLVRRVFPSVKHTLDIQPGVRAEFVFALDAPAGGWTAAAEALGDGALAVPLATEGMPLEPGFVFAREPGRLDPLAIRTAA